MIILLLMGITLVYRLSLLLLLLLLLLLVLAEMLHRYNISCQARAGLHRALPRTLFVSSCKCKSTKKPDSLIGKAQGLTIPISQKPSYQTMSSLVADLSAKSVRCRPSFPSLANHSILDTMVTVARCPSWPNPFSL